jgi:hypothetical protein
MSCRTSASASPAAGSFRLPSARTFSRDSVRRLLAFTLALLLVPLCEADLFAQQEAQPLQLGQPQQDYSGLIQSDEYGYPQQNSLQPFPSTPPPYDNAYPQPNAPAAVQPLDPARLEQLVAPIALYPDTLVALVLTASTYPQQVADADAWVQSQGNAPPEQIAAGANVQNWDPSVKALTAFPQVLAMMDRNQPWTTDLGTAYFNQPSDVLQAVQVMRQRAQAAGTLQPTMYEAVNYIGGSIQLAPVNPQFVYVPAYDPWSVYGQPISPYPDFSFIAQFGSFLGSAVLHWGPGIAMSAFTTMPWGLLAWGVSWLVQAILFHDANYYSRSNMVADWRFPHGGLRAAQGYRYSYPQRVQRGYGNAAMANGGVHRPPNAYPAGAYSGYPNSAGHHPPRVPGFVHRPQVAGGIVHRPPASGYARAGGYNIAPAPGYRYGSRPSSYPGYRASQGYGRGYGSQNYGYGRSPQQSYRPPADSRALNARMQRPNLGMRPSYRELGPRDYSRSTYAPPGRANGGFRPPSGNHSFERFHGGGAPKMAKMKAPKAPKSFGGRAFRRRRPLRRSLQR